MIVKKLTLKNYRNHKYISLLFDPSINLITGENGVGKTSVIEAIYYLSLARSFRGAEDNELILHGSELSQIDATIVEGNITREMRVIITDNAKKIFINGKPIYKLSELTKVVNVVLFEPKDVLLFRGLPKARRDFIDISISKKSPPYFEYLSRYDKLIKIRNNLLKEDVVDRKLLEANTEMLVKISGPIVSYREVYIKDINDILNKIARVLTGEDNKIEVIYNPFVKYDKDFQKNALNAFNRVLESDLKRKVSSIGPHREDFVVMLNGKEIGTFGSQGENRIVALALKLSPYFLIDDRAKRPIVVLDDVMSELDQTHQTKLIKFLRNFEQVFITATQLSVPNVKQYTLKAK